ncbi:hypothetical protein CEP54_006019 [Fusarium duplospermum]|uniref:Uncharacterized protein n=1 Tax=Fusarium duplospermum TaxID=1325734 RepID=A0A428Q9F8_9HYPO|nr:hypothetical protein CEP54_006019 [Fusarium duplospermum]
MALASGDCPIIPPLGPEPEPGTPKLRARHAGQPVFLGLTLKLEEESYAWLWRDKARKFANPKYTYDIWEENRIFTYNRAVVRTLARRSICKWAKHGSEGERQFNNDGMLGPGVIQELILARDYLADELAVCLAEHHPGLDIINSDISTINTNPAETTISSREVPTINSNTAIKAEPVPKVETGIKREPTTQRDAHVKTEAKASLAEDDDIIFVGTKLLSSAPAPGRCSYGGLCNHDAATITAPAPALTPAPAMAVRQNPVASSSRALEAISLISDSEGDDDFPSPPTRKCKERARAQTIPPTFPQVRS